MAKKCPPGKYYCFDDKKCKKIPRGYHIGARGYLARDTKDDDNETKKNGNGNSNGNGNGGNGSGNGNGGNGGNGGGNGGGGMGESIIYEKSNPRIPRKKGQPAKSKKHSDLYTDEDPKGTIHGLGFKDVAKAKASVSKIRNSSRSHAHKIQAAVAMEQRAREMGKTSEAAVYRKYINAMKKKTKRMNEAANPAQQAAIAIDMKKKGKKPKSMKEGMYNHSNVGLITNAVVELEDGLKNLKVITYDSVDQLMQSIAKRNGISETLLHNQFKAKHLQIPDDWAIRYRMNKRKGMEEAFKRPKIGSLGKSTGYKKTFDSPRIPGDGSNQRLSTDKMRQGGDGSNVSDDTQRKFKKYDSTAKVTKDTPTREKQPNDVREAKMTSAQKRKDTMLKKKYDDSDMKKNMQRQYGKEEGKKVYFATIRKQAMQKEEYITELSPNLLSRYMAKASGSLDKLANKANKRAIGIGQAAEKMSGVRPPDAFIGDTRRLKVVRNDGSGSNVIDARDRFGKKNKNEEYVNEKINPRLNSSAKRYKRISNKPKRQISAAEKKIFDRQKDTSGSGRFDQTTGRPKSAFDRSGFDTSKLTKPLKPRKGEVIDDNYKYNVSEEGLRDWFGKSSGTTKSGRKVRGWVQVGGKYDGKPCARQPGQKSTPKCVSSSKRRSMSKSERDSAARRKRAADPNQPQKSGAAKPTNVSTDPKRKMKENYFNRNKVIEEKKDIPKNVKKIAKELDAAVKMHTSQAKRLRAAGISEAKDKKGKGSGTKDACYHKVKSRYSVWPSAYASGALVKCRKVGAANWGNKSKNEGFSPMQVAALEAAGMIEIKEGQKCWKGYEKKGTKMMFGKRYNNCVKKKSTKEEVEHIDEKMINVTPRFAAARNEVRKKAIKSLAKDAAKPVGIAAAGAAGLGAAKMVTDKMRNEGVEFLKRKKEEKEKKKSKSEYVGQRDAGKLARRKMAKKDQEKVNFLEPEETNESKTRLVKNGHTYKVVLTWRGKTYMVQMFVPSVSRPTRQQVEKEIQKIYPDAKLMSFLPRDLEPGEPTVMVGEEKLNELKTRTMLNYIDKASDSARQLLNKSQKFEKKGKLKKAGQVRAKMDQRERGIAMAKDKIVKRQEDKTLTSLKRSYEGPDAMREGYSSKPSNIKKKAKLNAALKRLEDLKVKKKVKVNEVYKSGKEVARRNSDDIKRFMQMGKDAPRNEKLNKARGEGPDAYRKAKLDSGTKAGKSNLLKGIEKTKRPIGSGISSGAAARVAGGVGAGLVAANALKRVFNKEEFVSEDDMKGMSVKSGHKRPTEKGAGMTAKGVAAYRRRNPGSKLKTAVTGKVKKGSKDAKRRKSYCARSAGQMKKFPKAAKDPNSRLRQARRRWKC